MSHVLEKSRELIGADIERDADFSQLLLKDSCHQACTFFGRSFHGEMKAHAVYFRISRLAQQLPRPLRIVFVMGHIAVVSPALGRQNTVRGRAKSRQRYSRIGRRSMAYASACRTRV